MSILTLGYPSRERCLLAKAFNFGCRFLVFLSVVFCFYSIAPVNASNEPSPQERSAQDLAERTAQLEKAESTRKENPESYIYALTTMSSVIQNYNAVNGKPNEDSQADKYFDLALNCFMGNKFNKECGHRVASHLWKTCGTISLKEFKSIFDKMCMATNRELGDDFSSVDSDMLEALRNRRFDRGTGISTQEQLKFVQRAIAIRITALGARSKTLQGLFYSAGQNFEQRGDYKSAEQYYLKSVNLDSDEVSKASNAESMADFYLRQNDSVKAINSWRQFAAITTKNHLNFYIDGEFNKIKEFEKLGLLEYADEITNFMFANIQVNALENFDTFLKDVVNQCIKNCNFKNAQDLVQKRIATGIRLESTFGLTDWKIRLSNIYLAEGNNNESEALFKQIIANLALQGVPTDAIRRDRADLIMRMGK